MFNVSLWPERRVHLARWLLITGWLLLISSLLVPGLNPLPMERPCEGAPFCGGGPGNDIFWNRVLPLVLLSIVLSHELWRRICPLSFVSQLFAALGRQRTVPAPGGRRRLASVDPDSWLGRHHIQLQWSLLLAGLSVRLLAANSSPLALALLCLIALTGALVVGWAYGGKSWCHYVCPLGPVQAVITGPRGLMGTPAHLGARARTTQSMCRTLSPEGSEVSACVGCCTPCIDIDAERSYWKHLSGKRGLQWAWTSYPGVVLGFYLVIMATSPELRSGYWYLHSGAFSFDTRLPALALQPMLTIGPLTLPRLVVVPLVLAGGAALSSGLFARLECWLEGRTGEGDQSRRRAIARHRTRLLATLAAVNLFFFFKSNVLPFGGTTGERMVEVTVAAITAAWLWRGWGRDEATYRRESTSESLRRQLARLPNLAEVLEDRRLEELSPLEIFTLARAIPGLGLQKARDIYRSVMEDLLRRGCLSRAASLLQLEELRQSLHLEDQDHHRVVRELAAAEPRLLQVDGLERQRESLRRDAARESLEELMQMAGMEVLDPSALGATQRERLEQIRLNSGVDAEQWDGVLRAAGPEGPRQRELLRRRTEELGRVRTLQTVLAREAAADPLVRPLARALELRLQALEEGLRWRPGGPWPQDSGDGHQGPAGLAEALDLLWRDPDPDTAGWVLLLERLRWPERRRARLADPRIGLGSSTFLEAMRRDEGTHDVAGLPVLASCPLFGDLAPAGLLQVAAKGKWRQWPPGQVVLRMGDPSDGSGVVIRGQALVRAPDGGRIAMGPGQVVGEMGVISGAPRCADVMAGAEGLQLFWLDTAAFESLLQHSRGFSHGVLEQLVERLGSRERTGHTVAVS